MVWGWGRWRGRANHLHKSAQVRTIPHLRVSVCLHTRRVFQHIRCRGAFKLAAARRRHCRRSRRRRRRHRAFWQDGHISEPAEIQSSRREIVISRPRVLELGLEALDLILFVSDETACSLGGGGMQG